MDTLDFIMSCFNQYVFSEAKQGIEEIEYFTTTNPSTQGNKLIEEFIYAIKTYSLDTIDLPLFQSICAKCGKNDLETKDIIDRVITWKNYTKDQIAPTKHFLKNIIANSIIQRGNRLYGGEPAEFLQFCKNTDFRFGDESLVVESKIKDIDINSIIAEDAGTIIPSYFPFINEAYSDGGYHLGEMIMYCAVPGSGKSLWALTECMHIASMAPLPGRDKKLKVGMFLLGDLSVKDQILRAAAIYSGMDFKSAKENLSPIWKSMENTIGDNLTFITAPAGELSVEDIIDISKNREFDVVAIDYDSNIASSSSNSQQKGGNGSNMYQEWGEVYCKLTKLTAMNKLLFILAQPKISSWEFEEIGMLSLSESSRKQHTADTIITRGNYGECPNNLGIMKVCKCRRGNPNKRVRSIRLNNGRFITGLPESMYNTLKEEKNQVFYTEGEINQMIHYYRQQESQMERALSNVGIGGGNQQGVKQLSPTTPATNQSLGMTPFGKK